MKRLPLICAIWLVASCLAWAEDQQNRFLEIQMENNSLTFDLNTVQIISPGRFTVISTLIDNPDVMKQELKALGMLKSYCARPEGKYPAPADVLQLGPPDLPVEQIEVKTRDTPAGGNPIKLVTWKYPYLRLRLERNEGYFLCEQGKEDGMYMEMYRLRTSVERLIRLQTRPERFVHA